MSNIIFRDKAFEQFCEWGDRNVKTYKKIKKLIKESERTPFSGTGKPEPLKNNFSGCWSRRITDEHRLIYRVQNGILEILSCQGHYDD